MNENLLYTKSHEWVQFDGDKARIGLTNHAQEELGDIVFINLCNVGEHVSVHDVIGNVESIKAVSDIYAPMSGVVSDINQNVVDEPELINSAPYDSWLIELNNIEDKESLLTATEYEKFVQEGE